MIIRPLSLAVLRVKVLRRTQSSCWGGSRPALEWSEARLLPRDPFAPAPSARGQLRSAAAAASRKHRHAARVRPPPLEQMAGRTPCSPPSSQGIPIRILGNPSGEHGGEFDRRPLVMSLEAAGSEFEKARGHASHCYHTTLGVLPGASCIVGVVVTGETLTHMQHEISASKGSKIKSLKTKMQSA